MLNSRSFSEKQLIFDSTALTGTASRRDTSGQSSEYFDECLKNVYLFSTSDISVFRTADDPLEELYYIKAHNLGKDFDVMKDLPTDVQDFRKVDFDDSGWALPFNWPEQIPGQPSDCDFYVPPPPPPPPPPPYPGDPDHPTYQELLEHLKCIWYDSGGPGNVNVGRAVLFRHVFGLPKGKITKFPEMHLSFDDDALDPEPKDGGTLKPYAERVGRMYINGNDVNFSETPQVAETGRHVYIDPDFFHPGEKNVLAFMIYDEHKSRQTLKYITKIEVELEACLPEDCKTPNLGVCVGKEQFTLPYSPITAPPDVKYSITIPQPVPQIVSGKVEHFEMTPSQSLWKNVAVSPYRLESSTGYASQTRISICDKTSFPLKEWMYPLGVTYQEIHSLVKPMAGNDWAQLSPREYGLFAEYEIDYFMNDKPLHQEYYGTRVTIAPDEAQSPPSSRAYFNIAPLQRINPASPFALLVGELHPSSAHKISLNAERHYRMCLRTYVLFFYDQTRHRILSYALGGSVEIRSLSGLIVFTVAFAGNWVPVPILLDDMFLRSRIGLINMYGQVRFGEISVWRTR